MHSRVPFPAIFFLPFWNVLYFWNLFIFSSLSRPTLFVTIHSGQSVKQIAKDDQTIGKQVVREKD